MYYTQLVDGSNIPILTDKISKDDHTPWLRPVFYEELDLMGLNKFWDYPKSEAPLLWASSRNYIYRGIVVAELIGGNLQNAPEVKLHHSGTLKPIQIDRLIEDNKHALTSLENEAKLFINKVYKEHRHNCMFAVSFSGGKDSQAVYELVSQVVPPEDYILIFNDTGMEMPYTLETVAQTFSAHKRKFPNSHITVSNPVKDTVQLWNEFGPPTRKHRWCCTVCKTAPFLNSLKQINPNGAIIKNFVGIRSEESKTRKNYLRINTVGKHRGVSSIHPIFYWTSYEVYLYLISKGISVNEGYRMGLTRVGCSICPFSTPLSEYINYSSNKDVLQPFVDCIKNSMEITGIKPHMYDDYIETKNWAKLVRSSTVKKDGRDYRIINQVNDLVISTKTSFEEVMDGLMMFKHLRWSKVSDELNFEFTLNDVIIKGKTRIQKDRNEFTFCSIAENPTIVGLIKRAFNRITYCVHCGSCSAECPQMAIEIDTNKIDLSKCIHCLRCLTVFDNGCINAMGRMNIKGDNKMNKKGALNRYWGFGMRQEWINGFLADPEYWIASNGLGPIQHKAMINWLKDANLIEANNKPSQLCKLLRAKCTNEMATLISWLNIIEQSTVCNWWASLERKTYSRSDLDFLLGDIFSDITERSRTNALRSLIGTIKDTVISSNYSMYSVRTKGISVQSISKTESEDIEIEVLIYALYNFAKHSNTFNFTLTDAFSDDTTSKSIKELGISENLLKATLISLQEHRSKLVRVEFVANLDNIFLNKDLSATEALQIYLEGK
ncbi:MAG: phosphoadenosine phosphosulfate reductase family protein [Candidatus Cloacimonetes bacterium]|nr:phosphoadenosine phosphosulfate reductase family protein [Candidatus Cloacimonadota bacterium]